MRRSPKRKPSALRRFSLKLLEASFEQIAPRFLQGIKVDDKANGTPVTQADKCAEEAMRKLIEERYPTHGIFGEEYGIKEGQETEGVRYRWILDPVDGTRGFITNSFCSAPWWPSSVTTGRAFARFCPR